MLPILQMDPVPLSMMYKNHIEALLLRMDYILVSSSLLIQQVMEASWEVFQIQQRTNYQMYRINLEVEI